jgi:hypothetical protein
MLAQDLREVNLPIFYLLYMLILKTVCDLLDDSLSLVSAMILDSSPYIKYLITSSLLLTLHSANLLM